jgi:hypothetical protein
MTTVAVIVAWHLQAGIAQLIQLILRILHQVMV